MRNSVDVARYLIEKGADINFQTTVWLVQVLLGSSQQFGDRLASSWPQGDGAIVGAARGSHRLENHGNRGTRVIHTIDLTT